MSSWTLFYKERAYISSSVKLGATTEKVSCIKVLRALFYDLLKYKQIAKFLEQQEYPNSSSRRLAELQVILVIFLKKSIFWASPEVE